MRTAAALANGLLITKSTATISADRARLLVTEVYETHAEEFLHYALALGRDEGLAQDALQESFLRYFVALSKGEKIGSPRAWIYRVLHNFVLDRIKQARFQRGQRISMPTLSAESPNIERDCFHKELRRIVRASLSRREYDCFLLRAEGMRYGEIAVTLRLTSGTVGTLICRAMRKLRAISAPAQRTEA